MSGRSRGGAAADSLPDTVYGQTQPGVLSSAPRGTVVPNVLPLLPGRTPPVAAAQPRPGVLPFAGEAGHNLLGGLLGGLGVLSVGAALRLRGRRSEVDHSSGPSDAATPDDNDGSPALPESPEPSPRG